MKLQARADPQRPRETPTRAPGPGSESPLVASTSDAAIVVENLSRSYGRLKVLKGINLRVERGSVFALLGPNGAGKTTMVRIMSTLLLPHGGRVLIHGHDVVREPDRVRSVIGLTGQYAAVDEYLTGLENMEMMGRLYRLRQREARERSLALLEQFDLSDARNRTVRTYSGGMRRRLDLAASLIASPPVLFLDEPTTGLDPRSRLTMWEVVKDLSASGTTVLLTTQYMEEADQLADRIAVIDAGNVIAEGTSDELKQQIGRERLELRIDRASDFARARSVLDGEVVADEKNASLTVPMTDGVSELRELLGKMAEHGVEVESLSLHRPTLDDVFLTLTGHSAEADGEGGE